VVSDNTNNLSNLTFIIILVLFLIGSFILLSFGFISHSNTLSDILNNKENTGEMIKDELISEDGSVKIEFVYYIPENIKENDIIEIKIVNIEELNNKQKGENQ